MAASFYSILCKSCSGVFRKGAPIRPFSYHSIACVPGCTHRPLMTHPYSPYNKFRAHVNPLGPGASQYSSEAEQATLPEDEPVIIGPSDELLQSQSEEEQRKLKILWTEMEVLRQQGLPVPKQMTDAQWLEAASLPTRSQRLRLYRFLCIRTERKNRDKQKRAERREYCESQRFSMNLREIEQPPDAPLDYRLHRNTLFLRLRESTVNQMYNHWQCQGILFGQKLVVDLGYSEHMRNQESSNCAEQLRDLYAFNKMNRDPFQIYLCNANPNEQLIQHVEKFVPNLRTHSCMMTITEQSYLDLFPRERLVYLTPHCKNDIQQYDHDAIYIIGALVDKAIQQPLSLAKAKREGLRVAKIPLELYLDWGSGGNKSLTLDQMMKIMLDIKNTGNWETALQHVPRRKLRKDEPRLSPRSMFYPRHRKGLYED